MGVHCLTGRRGSGKTTRCVETIRKLLGTGAPILFLVPEQDTVEAEMHLASALNLSVFWNLEVLSLKRLAQRIGQNAGGGAQVTLSDAGRAMALKGAMRPSCAWRRINCRPRARWRRSCTTWRRSMRNTTGASRESIRTARTRSAAARSFAGSAGS